MNLSHYLSQLQLPTPESHKGQNGKVLIIGGSDLFHAASKWSLDTASKFVDMVFYSSVPSNNELIQQAKGQFWNGLVIKREDVPSYLDEADCVLIGPGMTRTPDTEELVNALVSQHPTKKWVIDAGALQMISPKLLTENCIVTPHHKEWAMLLEHAGVEVPDEHDHVALQHTSRNVLGGATVVLKGETDLVFNSEHVEEITGGNAGMTKGGTGDVLAGLIAGLYSTHPVFTAAVLGSVINKKAGEDLYKTVGPFFNASDLVEQIPKTLWKEYNQSS